MVPSPRAEVPFPGQPENPSVGATAPSHSRTAGPVGPHPLYGGVVAHREVGRVGRAVRSLTRQELPPGHFWDQIWVVVSGPEDGTADEVRSIEGEDPRVRLVWEPERRGKASAIMEIFRRAPKGNLILLNADAEAEPDAIRALLETAREASPPFAVMGHPVPLRGGVGAYGEALDLLWGLHHQVHLHLLSQGEGTHLSDELLLLPEGTRPELPAGTINDGAYLGAWIHRHAGRLLYSPGALVRVRVPRSLGGYLRQRSRIKRGHRQVKERTGIAPTTLPGYFWKDPRAMLAAIRQSLRGVPHPLRSLALLVVAEVAAQCVEIIGMDRDRRRPGVWTRVEEV